MTFWCAVRARPTLSVRFFNKCQSRDGLRPTRWAVRDLLGVRRALPNAFGVHTRPVSRNDLHARMLLKPSGQGRGTAVGEQVDRSVCLQVHQDGAVGVAFPEGPVVHTQDTWRRKVVWWQVVEQVDQRLAFGGPVKFLGEALPRSTAECEAKLHKGFREPGGAAGVGLRESRKAFGEEALRAVRVGAKAAPDVDVRLNAFVGPRQVCKAASVVAVLPYRRCGATGAGWLGAGAAHLSDEGMGIVILADAGGLDLAAGVQLLEFRKHP